MSIFKKKSIEVIEPEDSNDCYTYDEYVEKQKIEEQQEKEASKQRTVSAKETIKEHWAEDKPCVVCLVASDDSDFLEDLQGFNFYRKEVSNEHIETVFNLAYEKDIPVIINSKFFELYDCSKSKVFVLSKYHLRDEILSFSRSHDALDADLIEFYWIKTPENRMYGGPNSASVKKYQLSGVYHGTGE